MPKREHEDAKERKKADKAQARRAKPNTVVWHAENARKAAVYDRVAAKFAATKFAEKQAHEREASHVVAAEDASNVSSSSIAAIRKDSSGSAANIDESISTAAKDHAEPVKGLCNQEASSTIAAGQSATSCLVPPYMHLCCGPLVHMAKQPITQMLAKRPALKMLLVLPTWCLAASHQQAT